MFLLEFERYYTMTSLTQRAVRQVFGEIRVSLCSGSPHWQYADAVDAERKND